MRSILILCTVLCLAAVRLPAETMLAAAADHPQVRKTFERLRAASAERHLPAFERCAQRGQ